MIGKLFIILALGLIAQIMSLDKEIVLQQDPLTLYEYFGTPNNGTLVGLVADEEGFKLNGRQIRLISGAVHYFRVHPDYWRDRLRKLRANGANTVETYVAWNLHEPIKDQFDFGTGNNDMSIFLDLPRFIQIAREEDLVVLLRPGPFICSEFEFGGLPSWLLRDPNMKVRTAYQPYLDRVKVYLDNLLPLVRDLQFTQGGPIIALQIENEYASFDKVETEYLEVIQRSYIDNGMNESLFFTSDGSWFGEKGSLPGVLKTANFQSDPEQNLNDLLSFQPDKPVMAMEYWAGWFDHWFENHSTTDVEDFKSIVEVILGPYNGSVNFYMYHGGTNFGFNAGANSGGPVSYEPDVTSYDYDAPLSEAGDYTPKYYAIQELAARHQVPVLNWPAQPEESRKIAYPSVSVQQYLTFDDIISQVPDTAKFQMDYPVNIENLPMNSDCGQSGGYTLYRKVVPFETSATFTAGPVKDFGILLVDGEIQPYPKDENGTTMYWLHTVQEYNLQVTSGGNHTVDLLIENMGRVNFGYQKDFEQHKGLLHTPNDTYSLNGEEIQGIEIIALEFKSQWVQSLANWRQRNDSAEPLKAPVLIQSTFNVSEVGDTFVDMSSWSKGIVFINGFNLGRYWNVGPQQTLYLPGPFLKLGINTITIFEQLKPGDAIKFSDKPNLGPEYTKPVRKSGQQMASAQYLQIE